MGSTGHYLGLRPGLILVQQSILVHGLLPGLMLHELAAKTGSTSITWKGASARNGLRIIFIFCKENQRTNIVRS